MVLTSIGEENKIVCVKVVIHSPNWIGDSILAIPSLAALRKNLPYAKIWVATRPWVTELFSPLDFVEGIIPLLPQQDFMSLWNSARAIRAHHFDVGLLLPNSFSSALLFFLAKVPQRWGYQKDGRGLLLTKRVAPINLGRPIHQVHYYLSLLTGLGFEARSPELLLPLPSAAEEEAQAFLRSLNIDRESPLIIFHPGAAYGPSKRWPAQKYAELASLFQERNKASILIVGSKDEEECAETIVSLSRKRPINLVGKTTLGLLAGLIHQASLFVSNDSGPMHIANALRIPVVTIFGPTDPRQTGPFQEPSSVIKKEVPCWPCSYRECPYDHRCMMTIEAEEVYQISQRYL